MTRAALWTSCGWVAWATSCALLATGCPPENHRPPAPRYTVEKPARPDPPPPAPPPAPHHASHEHPHGAHPHSRSAHHHHPHPHPHLAGQNGHHHPY